MTANGELRPDVNPGVSRPVHTTYLIKQLELALRQSIDGSIRRYGLTTPPYMALIVLARNPGLSSAELARRCFVTPQAANEMVAVLERKGLVERHTDADNHRILDISLTETGLHILELCSSATSELEHRMVAGLGDADSEQFQALLERCLAAVRRPSPPPSLRRTRSHGGPRSLPGADAAFLTDTVRMRPAGPGWTTAGAFLQPSRTKPVGRDDDRTSAPEGKRSS